MTGHTTTAIITAFRDSPDKGRGLARDMQVRWALEEAGKPYAVRLVSFDDLKQPGHRALHPFGQIPTFEEDGLALFESGAIVLHIASTCSGLLPDDPVARARALAWMFAAHSTVEPPINDLEAAGFFERDRDWYGERAQIAQDRIRRRLVDLSAHLAQDEWLDGGFSAADVLMVGVLRRIDGSAVLREFPNLVAYVKRGEAREAFQRAFAAQLAVFEASRAR